MAAPDRKTSEEHDALNPPVIPCMMRLPKTQTGMIPQIGWEGFKLVQGERGWKVVKDQNFTLYILLDGYCEIPATPRNKEKLAILSKEIHHYPMKMVPAKDADGKDIQVPERNPETNAVIYDLEKPPRTEPPLFRVVSQKREFDPKTSTVDFIRPWLRQFVSVPGALMEDVVQ